MSLYHGKFTVYLRLVDIDFIIYQLYILIGLVCYKQAENCA